MAEELVMPRLSDTMEIGTVARWLLHEGDQVHAGDVVAATRQALGVDGG